MFLGKTHCYKIKLKNIWNNSKYIKEKLLISSYTKDAKDSNNKGWPIRKMVKY